jgi:two-component system sensor histidine kinase/response regulator
MNDNTMANDAAMTQAILDAIPDVIFCKDVDGVYRRGNKAWGELLGQPVDALLGKSDFELFPKDVATSFREQDLAMMLSRQSQRNDEWLDYPDGRRVRVETLKAPVFDRDGALIGLVGVCRDITQRAG